MLNIYTLHQTKEQLKVLITDAVKCSNIDVLQDLSQALREVEKAFTNMLYGKHSTLIAEGDLKEMLKLAKSFGYKYQDICNSVGIQPSNLSAYMQGKEKMLSMENQEKLRCYIMQLLLGDM
ncbi:hypothetical protein [Romboutsia ilealis]|uniref:hypothetical protein n=1 Tax=Romboutsia ilealis TaxID=1115758 RepID=UPI0026F3E1C4|nr:hypothetical protein [Romboutsia ilealis]